MSTIHTEILIWTSPEDAWAAARDVGALHSRLVPGFVTDTRLDASADPPVRLVTFASGLTLKETIVACDDRARRLVWTISGEGVVHHNGALSIHDAGPGQTRVVWIADVLPHNLADSFGPLMAQGLDVMRRHLEGAD